MPTGSITNNLPLFIGTSRLPGLVQAPITVDELEMFNRVLSINEIQPIYEACTTGKCKCLLITNEHVTCNQDGTLNYSFTLTNFSGSAVNAIHFVPPLGVTFSPNPVLIGPVAWAVLPR